MERETALHRSTVERYGYLWGTIEDAKPVTAYHYRGLRAKLPPDHLHGLALDAGCGPGIDAVHMTEDGAARVIALDPTPGGMAQAHRRAGNHSTVHPVQGRLERLPFPEQTFDFVYCYGVLHHLARPERGFSELARVLKDGGMLAIYVYEDFGEHTALERMLLRLVTAVRRQTVRWPPRWLYRGCQLAAPWVFLGFTVPSRICSKIPPLRPLSQRIPFRHAVSLRGLVGDLYDRFAAPLEHRYSREQVRQWFVSEGFEEIHVVPHCGWLADGRKRAC